MSIFPYIYYMIDSFKIATDDRQIAMYAGMVTSAFAFAEFSTGVLWGRLSDRIGRKPVLLTGLAGTGLSMLIFGFAKSLPVALLARALGGLLNGNIGVLQTTVAELVTVKEHQPRAYTIMPFVWCLGSILGPSLGGALAQPVVNYPGLFKPGTIFEKFPFLLPNLICTVVVLCGLAIGILFLEETHEGKKQRRDPGLEAGKWILNRVRGCTTAKSSRIEKTSDLMEVQALIHSDEPLPGYRSTEGSPQLPSTPSPSPEEPLSLDLNRCESAFSSRSRPKPKPAVSKAFTRQVALNIVGYGILA
jgi:MFS family permease